MEYKFNIGDKVRVMMSGSGFAGNQRGAIVTIKSRGEYFGEPGYSIEEVSQRYGCATLGNPATVYKGMNGESSFVLVEAVQVNPLVEQVDAKVQSLVDKVNAAKAEYKDAQRELSQAKAAQAFLKAL